MSYRQISHNGRAGAEAVVAEGARVASGSGSLSKVGIE
jgi:hypothetical protein